MFKGDKKYIKMEKGKQLKNVLQYKVFVKDQVMVKLKNIILAW